MPSSTTARRSVARNFNSVNGKPISLFRFPLVTKVLCSPTAALKIEAIISLTVVLPLLPVTNAKGMG